jgi:methyl-accepting chemotaxis protein/cytochrome b561
MTYSRAQQLIHWAIALLVTTQLAIAVVLSQLRSLEYGQLVLELHRQIGLVILMLVVVRLVGVRGQASRKNADGSLPTWQNVAATFVHRLFFLLLIVQPLIGMAVAWGRGDTVGVLGLFRLSAPFEMSDEGRERLMTLHTAVAILLFSMCLVHVGAVVFNRVVRRVSVIDRMLPSGPADQLVNRVPIGAQLSLAFGLVVTLALSMGINAVSTYRQFDRSVTLFQQREVAAADNIRSTQVAWKELSGLAMAGRASDEAPRLQELLDAARAGLDEAAAHTDVGDTRSQIDALVSKLAAFDLSALANLATLKDVDTRLQEIVDAQSLAAFQRRTENEQAAARGHDLIVLTVLPMVLAGIITALFLARSVTGSLSRMSVLIRGIESERHDANVTVRGGGEFAMLTRDIVSMRVAVETRSQAAADHRGQLEAERTRLSEEQQAHEAAVEAQRRIERQATRDRLAAEFEQQVAGIVDTVATTAQKLTSTSGAMAQSASNTTQRSREASSIAEHTSGTASHIVDGTQALSAAARAVRENAEKSRERALLAVQEATAAKDQIDTLVSAAKQISSITDVIAGVVRQTNLLAINARVEAARAGDVGRGFAIVANEVKDLASQTGNATAGIGKQIEEVTSAAARSSQSLERLREVIADLEVSADAIFKATDEQFASTRQIADRISEIGSSTSSVARNIRDAETTASTTEKLSGEVAGAAEIMDHQAEQLSEQVAHFVLQLRASASPAPAQSAATTSQGVARSA